MHAGAATAARQNLQCNHIIMTTRPRRGTPELETNEDPTQSPQFPRYSAAYRSVRSCTPAASSQRTPVVLRYPALARFFRAVLITCISMDKPHPLTHHYDYKTETRDDRAGVFDPTTFVHCCAQEERERRRDRFGRPGPATSTALLLA